MDEYKMVNEWLALATEKIKFGADRRAVHTELREHIEDKILDIRRIYPDMTEDAAAQRALCQMGDAREIGQELARIHRPWLGYLWRASQVFLVIMLLVALHFVRYPQWNVAPYSNWKDHIESYQARFPEQLPAETEYGPVRAVGRGSEIVSIGSYTFEIYRASVITPEDNAPFFYFTLRVHTTRPWEMPDRELAYWISVSDDTDHYWPGHREQGKYDGKANTSVGWARSGLTWREYEGYTFLYSYNKPIRYIPERPWEQTYTVHFNDGQTSFDIPITWEEVSP